MAGAATWYHYAPGHFRFLLPYYWEVIPPDRVERYNTTLREQLPGRRVPQYDLAIQRKALLPFTLPYALVEIEERPMPTPQEIEAERAAYDMSVRRAYRDLHREGLFGEITPMPAIYDDQRHIILGYTHMRRASDNQKLTLITATHPARYGFVRFHYFLPYETETQYLSAVETVLTSLTFSAAYAYDPTLLDSRTFPSYFGMLLRSVIVILAVVWLALRLASRHTVKKKNAV